MAVRIGAGELRCDLGAKDGLRHGAESLRQHFGERVFRTAIPRNIRLAEAPSHGLPALLYDLRSKGAEAYLQLAHEVIEREQARTASHPA